MTLILDNVSKKVGAETWIRDVSLSLERGSLNVLLGPTLAGKTSLMRLMAGLDVPNAGRVLVEGKDVTGLPVQRRSVAMVYQQFINYPSLSVYENIASPLRVARLPAGEIESRVREAARLLKLEPYLDRRPLNLSGGQQQRTAIARALVKRADLVLLDEPLANLDYKLREELREELPRVFAASGGIFVYATTEPTEALLLGGNTATLSLGELTQFGPTPRVYRQPHDLITAQVFSDPPLNLLTARKTGDVVSLSTGGEARAGGAFAVVADGEYRSVSAPTTSVSNPVEATCWRSPRQSRCPKSPDPRPISTWMRRNAVSSPWCPACKRLEPGASVTLYLDPATSFCSTPATARGRRFRRSGVRATWHASPSIISRTPTARPQGPQDYALKEIDHVWEQGGAYALLGPSGCGKTTLLNIISGLVAPEPGPHPVRRTGCDRSSDGSAQHRPGVPVPGRLRHHDGAREPGLPAEEPPCARSTRARARVEEIARPARSLARA